MNENKPLVIVLSRNYSTGLSVIRSLGAAGYTVDLLSSSYRKGKAAIAACSKYVHNSVEVVSQKLSEHSDNALLDEILKYAGNPDQKIVLFPTDDYTTALIDQNRSILGQHFITPTIAGGADGCLTARMDKTFQAELAKKAGLLTPKEWVISLEEEIEIPEDMVYPCFCKPIESVTGYKREMAKCSSKEKLYKHLQKLQDSFSHRSILVQEFLEIDGEIDLSGVCLDQEVIIPAIIRKVAIGHHSRGVTLAGRVVPFEEMGVLQEKILDMLRQFHYIGMFDMEFNIVGDRIYFNEVNLRSGGPNYAYFQSGVNLPALYVKEALGQRHTPEEAAASQLGKTFVYEKIAWEDYIHGYLTKQMLKKYLSSADITLLHDANDPAPGKLFHRQMIQSVFYQHIKNTKRNCKKIVRSAIALLKSVFRPFKQPLRRLKYALLGYPQSKQENQRDPFAEKPRVLVAGRNYCSNLCMAKSLGQAGYEVEVLRIFQQKPKPWDLMKILKPDAHSKYVKAYHVCYSYRKDRRILKKLDEIAVPYRKTLLIPSDDLIANIADVYYDHLSHHYLMPNVDHTPGQITHLMSKQVQKELAIASGLPVVSSCVIATHNHHFTIPETVTYPCFVKPNISRNSSKSRMRRCNSEQELQDTLTEFSRNKDVEVLVEDYLEIAKEYSMLGLSTRDGVIAPGFFVAEEGGHDAHRGVALVGRILSCKQEQKLIDDILAFVKSLNFEGLFDVDLIQTSDGKMYFTELNLRYGASGYAITQCGVNLPGMFADYMIQGKPLDTAARIQDPGKRFISEKIMIDEYVTGFLSFSRLRQLMKEVDIHFIQDDTDKRPYRHFRKFYLIASLMRIYYRIKAARAQQAG